MSSNVQLKSSVGVIGAGIQGVCIALNLIKKGLVLTKLINSLYPPARNNEKGVLNVSEETNEAFYDWVNEET